MFSRIRDKIGTAGLIVAIIALVAALGGGAYAAGLTGQEKSLIKKESQKYSKKYSKKYGGKPGPAGPGGPQGVPGTPGTNGLPGADGTNGTNGTDGKSVEVGGATVGECEDGGATVQVEGEPGTKEAICNGETGFTTTLPENETETGVWSFGQTVAGQAFTNAAISFSIPLAAALPGSNVHMINPAGQELILNESTFEIEAVAQTDCLGDAAEPSAPSGHLCVYAAALTGSIMASQFIYPPDLAPFAEPSEAGAGVSGARLYVNSEAAAAKGGWGSWAVTG